MYIYNKHCFYVNPRIYKINKKKSYDILGPID